jgi:hypothetical protein
MHYRLRVRRGRRFVPLIALSVFLAEPVVAGEIFKCVAKDGGPLYQNFPCDIDSLGWLPSTAPVAKTTPIPRAGSPETPKTQPLHTASSIALPVAGKSDLTGELRIGMSIDEVKALWGEPEEMVDDEPAEGGRVSLWRYAGGRSVQFDHKHHVMEVQR